MEYSSWLPFLCIFICLSMLSHISAFFSQTSQVPSANLRRHDLQFFLSLSLPFSEHSLTCQYPPGVVVPRIICNTPWMVITPSGKFSIVTVYAIVFASLPKSHICSSLHTKVLYKMLQDAWCSKHFCVNTCRKHSVKNRQNFMPAKHKYYINFTAFLKQSKWPLNLFQVQL